MSFDQSLEFKVRHGGLCSQVTAFGNYLRLWYTGELKRTKVLASNKKRAEAFIGSDA